MTLKMDTEPTEQEVCNNLKNSTDQETATATLEGFSKSRRFLQLHQILESNIAKKKDLVSIDESTGFLWSKETQFVYSSLLLQQSLGCSIDLWKWFLHPKRSSLMMTMFPSFLSHFNLDQAIPSSFRSSLLKCVSDTTNYLTNMTAQDDIKYFLRCSAAFMDLQLLLFMYHNIGDASKHLSFLQDSKEAKISSLTRDSLASDDEEVRQLSVALLVSKLRFTNYLQLTNGISIDASPGSSPQYKMIQDLLSFEKCRSYLLTSKVLDSIITHLDDDSISQLSDVLVGQTHSVPSQLILDCPAFQTAIVSSVLKSLKQTKNDDLVALVDHLTDSSIRWIECEPSSNPMTETPEWTKIKEAAKIFAQASDYPTDVMSVKSLVSLKNLVLLQSLTPVNQCRCCLFFSYLLVTSDSSAIRSQTMELFIQTLTGLRSVWLFDILSPSVLLNKLVTYPSEDESLEKFIGLILDRCFRSEDLIKDLLWNIKQCKTKGRFGTKRLYLLIFERAVKIQETRPAKILSSLPSLSPLVEASKKVVHKSIRRTFSKGIEQFLEDDFNISCLNMLFSKINDEDEEVLAITEAVVEHVMSTPTRVSNSIAKLLSVYHSKRANEKEPLTRLCKRLLDIDPQEDSSQKQKKTKYLNNTEKTHSFAVIVLHCNPDKEALLDCLIEQLTKDGVSESSLKSLAILITSDCESLKSLQSKATNLLLIFLANYRSEKSFSVESLHMLRICHAMLKGRCLTHQQLFLVMDILFVIGNESPESGEKELFNQILLSSLEIIREILANYESSVSVGISVFGILCCKFLNACLRLTSDKFVDNESDLSSAQKTVQALGSVISRFNCLKSFSSVSPEILTTYVKFSRIWPTHPKTKHLFLSIIYRIMKSIDENQDEMERLLERLTHPEKILFRYLTSNYDKYYRYKGYV